MRPQWRAPLGSLNRPTDRHRSDTEAMPKARLAVHRRSACSGVKALRNTSAAKAASRQALLPFRSLDPFRALREPDRRRRDEERPFPLRTKNWQQNPKQPLDRKSPIQVRCEPDFQGRIPSMARAEIAGCPRARRRPEGSRSRESSSRCSQRANSAGTPCGFSKFRADRRVRGRFRAAAVQFVACSSHSFAAGVWR